MEKSNQADSKHFFKKFLRILGFVKPFTGLLLLTLLFNTLFSIVTTVTVATIKPIFQILFQQEIPNEVSTSAKITFFDDIKSSFYNGIANLVSNNSDQFITLINLSIFIIALFVLKSVFKFMSASSSVKLEEGIIRSIRNKVFKNLVNLSIDFFNRKQEGTLISVITNDVNTVNSTTISSLTIILREGVQVLLFVMLLFTISPYLTLISFSTSIISLLVLRFLLKFLRRYASRMQNAMADYTTVLHETVSGIRVVKSYNAENQAFRRFFNQTADYVRSSVKHQKVITLIPSINEIFAIIALCVVLFVGGSQVLSGSMKADDLMLFLFSLFAAMSPITTVFNSISQFQRGIVAAERVFDIMDEKPTVANGNKAIDKFENHIVIENVSFSYTDSEVITSVSLKIDKRKKIAFVGSSGSGKSTMLDLIVRFYDPSSGNIKIDDADIRDFDLKSLRSLFGIVSQETILFNDTVAANIAFGKDDATIDEIINAAKIANAYDFIMQLPDGLNTNIGDRGVTLSGGERQRISIARALLRNPQILVFDEATSALDSESEKIVQEAIYRSLESRTAIIVAHRLATIIDCDEIFVFDKGRIVESGSHPDLLTQNGMYKKLYDIQFSSKEL